MINTNIRAKAENDNALNFRITVYALELFEINFKKIIKTPKGYFSIEQENFKNEIKNQFFEFLIKENPWENDNYKRNTEIGVRHYFNIIKSIK